MAATRLFLQTMVKHLPPSASALRLIDVGGAAAETLRELRADLDVMVVSADRWAVDENSADAVVAYGVGLEGELLAQALRALRPGGRLIVVNPNGEPDKAYVDTLEAAGYARILVEALYGSRVGVLMRGEKPHVTSDTLERVEQVARRDTAADDLAAFKGRYVHLLVRQKPNKPVWALRPEDVVTWEALALERNGAAAVLSFSSLPNAVAFMQAAVLAGTIRDVNRVAKFSRQTAEGWPFPVLVNPSAEVLQGQRLTTLSVDPATAELADE
jgi:SAM-dependent methyltransferase